MAYKFQLGTAKLSGSVQLTDGSIDSTNVDDTTAANIVTQIDAGEIPTAKLANDTISGITLGSNLNSLSKATNGGVNFSSYNGSAAVSDLALDLSDLAAAAVNVGADSIAIYDADADVTGKETIADLMTAVAGDGLAASSGVLAVGVDDSSLEINSDALRVKASGVTNAMLAGSIANDKLSNSTISGISLGSNLNSLSKATNGGVNFSSYNGSAAVSDLALDLSDLAAAAVDASADSIAIYDSDADVTGLESIADLASAMASGTGIVASSGQFAVDGVLEDLDSLGAPSADGEFIVATGAGAFAYESGATVRTSLGLGTGDSPQFTDLTLSGDLTVNGSLTTINTTDLEVTDKNILIASGSNAAGAVGAGLSVDGANVDWIYADQGENVGGVDATGSGDIWIASGSAGLIDIQAANFYGDFNGDGSGLTGVSIVLNVNEIGDANATLAIGVNVATANTTAARTWTLPASPSVGQSVKVKVAGVSSGAITVQRAGSQTIDGSETSILLESDNAAVELIYVASDDWRVF